MINNIFPRMMRALAIAFAIGVIPLAAPAQEATQASSEVRLGSLVISDAFARATLPHAPVGGGFMTITNTGNADDRLISASSLVAGRVEVHEMSMQGDVMKMRKLENGLPVPAGETVTLKPGGYHLMFMDLKQPLEEGATVTVKLTFQKAGMIEVPLVVGPVNAGARGMSPMNGGSTMDDSTHGIRIDNGMTHQKTPDSESSAPVSLG